MIEQIKNKISALVENTKRGLTMGREALKNDFAEHFQDGGKRKSYMFNNQYWDDVTFLMKYPLDFTESTYVFANSNITHIDVPIILNGSLYVEELSDTIPLEIGSIFAHARKLETIEEIRINENTNQQYSNLFSNCDSLKNINKIIGTISGDGLDFTQTQITPETMMRIIDALGWGDFLCTILFSSAQYTALENKYPYSEIYPDNTYVGVVDWGSHIYQIKGFNI